MRKVEVQDRGLLIWGGASGVVMTVVYGLGQALPATGISVTPAIIMQIFFWTAALFGPLGMINSYAVYRVLAWEREGALNRLALLMSLVGYAIVTVMLLVQGAVSYYAGEVSLAPSIMQVIRAVDLGIDLAWDIFFGVSLALTALVMMRHSRFGPLWGYPAAILGLLLIVLNAVTAPVPPNAAGLVDVGPVTAIYGILLSVYIMRIGIAMKSGGPRIRPSTPLL